MYFWSEESLTFSDYRHENESLFLGAIVGASAFQVNRVNFQTCRGVEGICITRRVCMCVCVCTNKGGVTLRFYALF